MSEFAGRLSPAERGLNVHVGSKGSRRPEHQIKRPTTMVPHSDELPVVGRDEDAKGLVAMLNGSVKSIQVISITGEDGIGKTAFVRSVYDSPEIKKLFPCQAWISYTNGMSLWHVLVELIKQSPATKLKDFNLKNVPELFGMVYRSGRFLIVLDDLKDFELDIESLLGQLPETFRGSRVIVTSREVLLSLAGEKQWFLSLQLPQLEEKYRRELLMRIYRIEDEVIKAILRKCKGSPMKLLLCGGLVAASDAGSETLVGWLDSLGRDPTGEAIMHLSYLKLPHWVKPCLLYFCLFPRGSEIRTRRVFQLLYAEGLALRNNQMTAEVCLQELLDRNIVRVVTRRLADGSPKTCCLPGYWHDYLSDLAARFGLLDVGGNDKRVLRNTSSTAAFPWVVRCTGERTSLPPQDTRTASRIRSYVSFNTGKSGKQSWEVKLLLKPLQGIRQTALLRVLDLEGVYKPKLPDQFGDLLSNLRYLGLRWTILDLLPKSVAKLSNLETLDLKHTEVNKLPGSILTLKYLRQLYLNEVSFDNDVPKGNFGSNIETLWGLSIGKGSSMLKILGKFKGLRKLGLTCHSADVREATQNISTLTKLELLRLRSRDLLGQPGNLELGPHMKGMLHLLKLYLLGRLDGFGGLSCLPGNLRVLTLSMSELSYDPMSSLGQLQHLVRLSLLGRSCIGETITCPGRSFPSLRELRLWKLDQLREIRMEVGSMKSLEELEIRGCERARKINGLNNASKLKHVKLTEVTRQFASEIKHCSSKQNWMVTSRELILEYLSYDLEDGLPGFLGTEDSDLFRGIPFPVAAESETSHSPPANINPSRMANFGPLPPFNPLPPAKFHSLPLLDMDLPQ